MRNVALVCVLLAVGVAAQQEANPDTVVHEPKTATRVLPADVLRDFPGMCYGSTTYRSYQVGVTWELGAFCGRSTCLKNATGFFEKVEDCGPVPKANENCRAVPGTGPAFPDCCPKYECVRGVNLEYPTEAEIKAAVEEARKAQEEQLRAAQREQQGPDPQAPAQG